MILGTHAIEHTLVPLTIFLSVLICVLVVVPSGLLVVVILLPVLAAMPVIASAQMITPTRGC